MNIKKFSHNGYQFFIVKNDANLEITFSSCGASIYSIKYKNTTLTYHPEDYSEFLKSTKYYGKTLGRVAGRLKDGTLKINKEIYNLEKNENNNTLHGGFNNISFKNFETVFSETEEMINVVFKYTSPHLECGFPGEVRFIIVYSISKNRDKFLIHYHAVSNKETPINMSTHVYWRLMGDNVLNHELFIDAKENTTVDKALLTTGKSKVNKFFDFNKSKLIGKDIKEVAKFNPSANGYDHGFIFNKGDNEKVVLKANHIKLSVKTDMKMVNIYTNNFPKDDKILDYGKDVVYGGIAIEPQMYFTSYKDLLIDSNHPFDKFISFSLEDY